MDMLGTVLFGVAAGIIVAAAVMSLDTALRRIEHGLDDRAGYEDDDD